MREVDWGLVGRFYGLAMAGSVLCGLVYYLLGDQAWLRLPLLLVLMYTPALSAIAVLTWRGEPLVERLGLRLRAPAWLALSLLVAMALVAGMLLWGWLLPGVGWDPSVEGMLGRFATALPPDQLELAREQLESLPVHPVLLSFLGILIAGPTLNAVAALGEELGWRGLLDHALRPLGFWGNSLLTGALWGLWHAPVVIQGYNFPEHPLVGCGLMIVAGMAFSPLFTFLRARSRTVISSAFLHGGFNAGAGIPFLVLTGPDVLVQPLGVVGILSMATLDLGLLALWIADPRQLDPREPV